MQEVTYDFGFDERLSHTVLRSDRIDLALPRPGLYSWHLRSPIDSSNEIACQPYRNVFSKRRFEINATAPLGERLTGRMNRIQAKIRALKPGETLDEDLFAAAFAAFAPPLYIGRSKNVLKRLKTHLAALEAELNLGTPSDPDIFEDAVPDTDEESSKFGGRMGNLLRLQGLDHYRGLYAKVVYAGDNEATKRAEYLLNRTFHPILGRI